MSVPMRCARLSLKARFPPREMEGAPAKQSGCREAHATIEPLDDQTSAKFISDADCSTADAGALAYPEPCDHHDDSFSGGQHRLAFQNGQHDLFGASLLL